MGGVEAPLINFPSDEQGIGATLTGRVQVMFTGSGNASEYITSGKLRPLAISSAARSHTLQDVPTIGEFVTGYEYSTWFGIGAPKNTSNEAIDTLNKAINASFADPKVMAYFAEASLVSMPMTPAEFGKFIADETERLAKVVKLTGIKPN